MSVDTTAAARFVHDAARLLDRHRFAALFAGGSTDAVLAALRAYRNPDGGFGHALEPDLRAPTSQPGATLYALEILAELGVRDDPMIADAVGWIDSIAAPDGGVPSIVGDVSSWPHAPWWQPDDGGFLTAALAGALHELGVQHPWVDRATAWSWDQLRRRGFDSPYWWKHVVAFLDRVPDRERAEAELARIREPLLASPAIELDPRVEREHLTPLDYSPMPELRSRALFTPEVIERHLDALEAGQREDGGWMFDWAQWSPGATLDWRGSLTVRALTVLRANGRLG